MASAFVGPLSRFFANGDEEAADRMVVGVERWRADLRAGVADKIAAQLDWDERSERGSVFDLGEAGWMALRLFAFYAERSDLEWPDTVPPLLEFDQEWRKAAEQGFAKSLYGQVLACELWLPGSFPVTIRAPRPDGEATEIGSLTVLRDQLQWLNQRTFQAGADEVAVWREQPAPAGGAFLPAVRRGFAALSAAVQCAFDVSLPLMVNAAA
ncbi:MAG TPA: hypothetical protein ENI87_11035 [bacterium]|nr:hypothetical protein [bacterium]